MDGERFDTITRQLARAASRRRMLRAVLGTGVLALLGGRSVTRAANSDFQDCIFACDVRCPDPDCPGQCKRSCTVECQDVADPDLHWDCWRTCVVRCDRTTCTQEQCAKPCPQVCTPACDSPECQCLIDCQRSPTGIETRNTCARECLGTPAAGTANDGTGMLGAAPADQGSAAGRKQPRGGRKRRRKGHQRQR